MSCVRTRQTGPLFSVGCLCCASLNPTSLGHTEEEWCLSRKSTHTDMPSHLTSTRDDEKASTAGGFIFIRRTNISRKTMFLWEEGLACLPGGCGRLESSVDNTQARPRTRFPSLSPEADQARERGRGKRLGPKTTQPFKRSHSFTLIFRNHGHETTLAFRHKK